MNRPNGLFFWICTHLALLLLCVNLRHESDGARRRVGHPTGPLGRGKSGRIFNGTEVTPPFKCPYVGMLWWNGCLEPEKPGNCSYAFLEGARCGITVIDKYWAVTAAHCCVFNNASNLYGVSVIFGIHNWTQVEPWTQNLTIAECIPHELYL